MLGGGIQPPQVGVGDSPGGGAPPLDLGKAQVAGHDLPGTVDDSGSMAEEPSSQPLVPAGQAVAQGQGLQCGDAHALPVGRVEAAQRVADDQQTVGEPPEPLVVPADTGREAVRHGMVHRLGVPDRFVDVRHPQASGVCDEPVRVGGRLVPDQAAEGDDRATKARERGADHDDCVAAQVFGREPVVARRVLQGHAEVLLGRPRVA